MIIPDPAAFVNAGRASEKRGRKLAFPVASAGRVWYNVGKVAGNGGQIGEIVGHNQDDASTVSNCYCLRSTDEDTNPAAKSAEEFAGGTVLAIALLGTLHCRRFCGTKFGGITGDLAGWFLCRMELAVVLGLWAVGILTGIF